ncbi:MAG TPA: hypothetical protein VJT78_12605 [Candidatus Dormibacteraeota bacterium]|nr:hypothetical protein [Candidatus Dormibacteraeota bacterium]
MPRFRMRFVLAAFVVLTPILVAGIAIVPMTFANETCTDPATDNDKEYAGDVDVWCSAGTSPSPSPLTAPSPVASPTAAPTSAPPLQAPSPPSAPGPVASACVAGTTFPTSFFGPGFTGPVTRTFNSQFIADYGTYVETCYPAGSSAPSSGVPGGAQAKLPMAAGAADDATLTYQIRFPIGTQFVKGGKLPGLCGGQCWTGSNNGPGGFAFRLMWRAGGAGEVLESDASTTGYGTDLGRGTSFFFSADGKWHTIVEHVHLNSVGSADGYVDLTYDGQLWHFGGLTIRTDSTRIDSLIFSTFYGGHDSTWAPTAMQVFDFANFQVTP